MTDSDDGISIDYSDLDSICSGDEEEIFRELAAPITKEVAGCVKTPVKTPCADDESQQASRIHVNEDEEVPISHLDVKEKVPISHQNENEAAPLQPESTSIAKPVLVSNTSPRWQPYRRQVSRWDTGPQNLVHPTNPIAEPAGIMDPVQMMTNGSGQLSCGQFGNQTQGPKIPALFTATYREHKMSQRGKWGRGRRRGNRRPGPNYPFQNQNSMAPNSGTWWPNSFTPQHQLVTGWPPQGVSGSPSHGFGENPPAEAPYSAPMDYEAPYLRFGPLSFDRDLSSASNTYQNGDNLERQPVVPPESPKPSAGRFQPFSPVHSPLGAKSWSDIAEKICSTVRSEKSTPEREPLASSVHSCVSPVKPVDVCRLFHNLSPNDKPMEEAILTGRTFDSVWSPNDEPMEEAAVTGRTFDSMWSPNVEEPIKTVRPFDSMSPNCKTVEEPTVTCRTFATKSPERADEPLVTCRTIGNMSPEAVEESEDPFGRFDDMSRSPLNFTILNPPPAPVIGALPRRSILDRLGDYLDDDKDSSSSSSSSLDDLPLSTLLTRPKSPKETSLLRTTPVATSTPLSTTLLGYSSQGTTLSSISTPVTASIAITAPGAISLHSTPMCVPAASESDNLPQSTPLAMPYVTLPCLAVPLACAPLESSSRDSPRADSSGDDSPDDAPVSPSHESQDLESEAESGDLVICESPEEDDVTSLPGDAAEGDDDTSLPGDAAEADDDTSLPGDAAEGDDTSLSGNAAEGEDTSLPGNAAEGGDVTSLPGDAAEGDDVTSLPGDAPEGDCTSSSGDEVELVTLSQDDEVEVTNSEALGSSQPFKNVVDTENSVKVEFVTPEVDIMEIIPCEVTLRRFDSFQDKVQSPVGVSSTEAEEPSEVKMCQGNEVEVETTPSEDKNSNEVVLRRSEHFTLQKTPGRESSTDVAEVSEAKTRQGSEVEKIPSEEENGLELILRMSESFHNNLSTLLKSHVRESSTEPVEVSETKSCQSSEVEKIPSEVVLRTEHFYDDASVSSAEAEETPEVKTCQDNEVEVELIPCEEIDSHEVVLRRSEHSHNDVSTLQKSHVSESSTDVAEVSDARTCQGSEVEKIRSEEEDGHDVFLRRSERSESSQGVSPRVDETTCEVTGGADVTRRSSTSFSEVQDSSLSISSTSSSESSDEVPAEAACSPAVPEEIESGEISITGELAAVQTSPEVQCSPSSELPSQVRPCEAEVVQIQHTPEVQHTSEFSPIDPEEVLIVEEKVVEPSAEGVRGRIIQEFLDLSSESDSVGDMNGAPNRRKRQRRDDSSYEELSTVKMTPLILKGLGPNPFGKPKVKKTYYPRVSLDPELEVRLYNLPFGIKMSEISDLCRQVADPVAIFKLSGTSASIVFTSSFHADMFVLYHKNTRLFGQPIIAERPVVTIE